MDPAAWAVLGHHITPLGDSVPVGLPTRDLQAHTVVLGTSGSGKSTVLRNLALQFFSLGGSVIVIEPHGDLCLDPQEGIVAALAPAQLPHTTILDLTSDCPPQINLASTGLLNGRPAAVQTAMRCIHAMEDANWHMAVRMREILENSLHVLVDVLGAEASLLHLLRFLVESPYRATILKRASAEVATSVEWWHRRLAQWSAARRREPLEDILEPAERRVLGFMVDDHFRRALALPPLAPDIALDLGVLMGADEPHLVLVPLRSKNLGRRSKQVFGTLLMQIISGVFLARADEVQAMRRPTLVILDELADLAAGEVGALVAQLLAQARKFGAAVVLSTQSLAQLPDAVQDEVKANTSNKIVMRAASEDDARLGLMNLGASELRPVDLMNLPRFHGYARTLVRQAPQPAFYFHALPPLQGVRPLHLMRQAEGAQTVPLSQLQETTLAALYQRVARDVEGAIRRLVLMGEAEWRQVVAAQVAANRQALYELEREAEKESREERVEQALALSRARCGLPWWLLEAHFRRLRNSHPGATGDS